MAYTTPITWTATVVTVDNLNEQVRDNLTALASPAFDSDTGGSGSTTSTSLANLSISGGSLSITPQVTGRVMLVIELDRVYISGGAGTASVSWYNGTTNLTARDIYQEVGSSPAQYTPTHTTHIVTGLTNGVTITYTPRVKVSANTFNWSAVTVYAYEF